MDDFHENVRELEALLSRLVDGVLTIEQRDRLSELLRGNALAQDLYRNYINMHVSLEFQLGSDSPMAPRILNDANFDRTVSAFESNSGSKFPFSDAMILPTIHEEQGGEGSPSVQLPPLPRVPPRSREFVPLEPASRFRRYWMWGGLCAAAALLVAGAILPVLLPQPPAAKPLPRPEIPPVVASLSGELNAKWRGESVPLVSNVFRRGQRVVLDDGYAQLTFSTGANVILQGPAELTFDSDSRISLTTGRLAAKVEGGGFVVETPSATVTDLGTEFGVSIAPDQVTRVDVFKGKVRAETVEHAAAPVRERLLHAGEASEVAGSELKVDPLGAQPQRFVRTLGDVRVRGEMLLDLRPDVTAGAAVWRNHAEGGDSVGDFAPAGNNRMVVEGVEGPLGKKMPVVHFGPSATTSLVSARSIPAAVGENGDVSVEAWIRADAPLGEFNTVAAWGEPKPGAERAFLYGHTTPFMGYYADVANWGGYIPTPGIWHYVVWVYQGESGSMSVYVDGRKVQSGQLDLHTSVSPVVLGGGPGMSNRDNSSLVTFSGELGVLRIETGLLTSDDIAHNFARGMTPETDTPAAGN